MSEPASRGGGEGDAPEASKTGTETLNKPNGEAQRKEATDAEHGRVIQAGEVRSARIESLRAIAALGVYTAHTWGLATQYDVTFIDDPLNQLPFNGTLGVLMFFSLAGYLLFWPFSRQIFGSGERIDLRQYAINRTVRILPLYFIAVAILMFLDGEATNWSWWLSYLTLTANFNLPSLALDGPLWSVAVEIHFYILLPFLAMALAATCGRSIWKAVLILLALSVASFLYALAYVEPNVSSVAGKSLLSKFYYFIPGMMIALVRVKWQRDGVPRWFRGAITYSDLWFLAALLILAENALRVVYFPAVLEINPNYFPQHTVAFALIVGACVLPLRSGLVTRALGWKWLAAFGTITYSFYVWHRPILEAIAGRHQWFAPELYAITLPVVLAVSVVSYRLIEAPFLRLRKRWATSAPQHVAGSGGSRGGPAAPAPAPG